MEKAKDRIYIPQFRHNTDTFKSEEVYRTMFDTMIKGFVYLSLSFREGKVVNYRYEEVNAAFEEITGLKRDKIIGRKAFELFPDIERVWIDKINETIYIGQPVYYEGCFLDTDTGYEAVFYIPEDGKAAIIFSDIFTYPFIIKEPDDLVFNCGQPFIFIDSDKDVVSFNKAADRVLNFDSKHNLKCGNKIDMIYPFSQAGGFNSALRKALDGAIVTFELKMLRFSGEQLWFELRLISAGDNKSGAKGVYMTMFDITKRKLYEETIKEKDLELRGLLNFFPVIVCEIDLEGNILFINKLGLSRFEFQKSISIETFNIFDLICDTESNHLKNDLTQVSQIKLSKCIFWL